MDYTYRRASICDLNHIWDQNIQDHPGDLRWVNWKAQYIDYNRNGMAQTYVILFKEKPIGECTLLFDPRCKAAHGNLQLADGRTVANVNGLRIRKAHEGKGHISGLMRFLEADAAARGYTHLSIGVEAAQARNLGIYLHWGYTNFLFHEIDEGTLVLYYKKELPLG